MTPAPGTYRGLFIKALEFYEAEHAQITAEEKLAVRYYVNLLHDTNFKFGQITTDGKVWAPGELFLRS